MTLKGICLQKNGWEAEVLPEYGMNMIRLSCRGKEVLRTPATEQEIRETPQVYGMPLLLPPNRTAGGTFVFHGKTYHLPINEPAFGNHIHGSLSKTPFRVLQHSPDSVTGIYENRGECYPFPFRITVTHRLTDQGTRHSFTICNTGNGAMPLAFGLHIAFRAPTFFAVPIGQRWETDRCYIPTGRLLPLTEEEKTYRQGQSACRGKTIRGFFTSEGRSARIGKIKLTVSEQFDQWVLWNGDGTQGFLCIEPMSGAVNALNSGQGLLELIPGTAVSYAVALTDVP